MRRSVDLDSYLEAELSHVVSLTRERPVANRFQSPRPDGYFAGDYGTDSERVALEKSMSRVKQRPER